MNLSIEYYKRHDEKFIMPTNDGLCFFNEYKRPAFICHTSTNPKTHNICYRCGHKDSLIVLEVFSPHRDAVFQQITHQHIHPDGDILEEMLKFGTLTPVSFGCNEKLDTWLWKFFLFHNRLRRAKSWIKWKEEQEECPEPLDTYNEMTFCAKHYPKVYNEYYGMYQKLISGRKYLLYE